ncbi:hypothetical protein [Flammeovirga pacifica]|uniref:Uncharacterized protein n=1 Tax=Flammeovirga pacifica TaxID=915059 RepID=A0A1S1YTE9_FLAPC|nr:hypothetical protein [Flammeovirga pacifica]OHX64288.1 hypothetical protein NH26_22060 [Flammeovirga pacifica]
MYDLYSVISNLPAALFACGAILIIITVFMFFTLSLNTIAYDGENVIISNRIFGKEEVINLDDINTLASSDFKLNANDVYGMGNFVKLFYTNKNGKIKSIYSLNHIGDSLESDMILMLSKLKIEKENHK